MKKNNDRKVFTERSASSTAQDKNTSLHSLASLYRVKIFRAILLFLLIATGVLSGVLSYFLLKKQEHDKYLVEFNSVANEIFLSVDQGFEAKLLVLEHMSTIFSYACPDSDDWPNCNVPQRYFEDISSSLVDVSKARSIAANPLVYPDQKESFEEYAYARFEAEGFPEQTGISSFGEGMFAKYSNGSRYADDGKTNFSDYELFLPVFQPAALDKNWPGIMYNMHSEPVRAAAIDAVLDCVTGLADVQKSGVSIVQRCTSVTDFIQLVSDAKPSPASIIYTPVMPYNVNTTVVGMNTIIFNWESILATSNDFGDRSIDCEVETSVSGSTLSRSSFELSSSGAAYKENGINGGSGKWNNDLISAKLSYGTELATNVEYTLHFRPTRDFYNSFHSQTPLWASAVCVAITIVISVMFMIYNLLVKREALENKMLLDSKRVFVRFISHEIRTPMNCITLGLQLLASRLRSVDNSHSHTGVFSTLIDSPQAGQEEADDSVRDYSSRQQNSFGRANSIRRDSRRLNQAEMIEDCLEIVKEIADSSKTAVVVLNELISYDKIEMDKFNIERRMCNIYKILRETFHPLEVSAKQRDVQLKLRKGDTMSDVVYAIGDAIKLGQVFRNIISNALKFTPPKGSVIVQAYIDTDAQSSSEMATIVLDPVTGDEFNHIGDFVVSVTDTGPGLSPQQQEKMFQEGVQFNANDLQARGGSGLGMWISKEIVKRHGGNIKVFSEGLGKGCTFSATFPALEPVNDKNSNSLSRRMVSNEEGDLVSAEIPGSVLVVDDSAISIKILSRLLLNAGVTEVSAAHDGNECLEIVRNSSASENFDLIVMDYEMPVLNGPDATRCLRNMKCTAPIIGVTGNVLAEDKKLFLSAGANMVLAKPLRLCQLFDAYTTIVTKKQNLTLIEDAEESAAI